MKTRSSGWKFPLFFALFALGPVFPASSQSAPAKAPARVRKPASRAKAAATKKSAPAPAAVETQFPLPPPGQPDAEAQYAEKRARILLAEERRDPALLSGPLTDGEAKVRARAARALGRIGAPGAADGLARLLSDDAPEAQAGAAWGALYLGAAARPLIPRLRGFLAPGHAGQLPAIETLIGLGDAGSEKAVLEAIEATPLLRFQVAGHLFHLDTPAVRQLLKDWARINQDQSIQSAAMASLVRMKLDDEPFYRDILSRRQGESAVWAVKGLGLAKKPAAETITLLGQVAKRTNDPMVRDEALKFLMKANLPSALHLFRTSDLAANAQTVTALLDGLPSDMCLISHLSISSTGLSEKESEMDLNYFHQAIRVQDSYRRRLAMKCTKVQYDRFGFEKTGESYRVRAAHADGFGENVAGKEELQNLGKDADSRVRASAVSALIQNGSSANPWLADNSAEVVANAADAASRLKPEELTDKRLSGDELMKAYQRFSAKDAEDGPNTRLYIVRAAAACAAAQPACLNVLKNAQSDTVRTVQINAWERWPEAEALRKQRPEWPKPNLPPPDFAGARARLESLLHGPQQFEVETTRGKFTMVFTARGEAPLNVLNFRELVKKRYFDGISWHRVVPNFVVQAGDPRGDGSGGPGWMVPCETNSFGYKAGTVGMALDGKDSGGSQWFVTLTAQPHLDFHYTVLGQVVSGIETLHKLGEDDKIITLREITPDPAPTAEAKP